MAEELLADVSLLDLGSATLHDDAGLTGSSPPEELLKGTSLLDSGSAADENIGASDEDIVSPESDDVASSEEQAKRTALAAVTIIEDTADLSSIR